MFLNFLCDFCFNPLERRQCRKNEYSCLSERKCVSINRKCDGVEDCDDGSDEFLCCKLERERERAVSANNSLAYNHQLQYSTLELNNAKYLSVPVSVQGLHGYHPTLRCSPHATLSITTFLFTFLFT